MNVNELVKENGYDFYPKDNSIIEKISLKFENNQVICNVDYHQVFNNEDVNLAEAIRSSLTDEEYKHLKSNLTRLHLKVKGATK